MQSASNQYLQSAVLTATPEQLQLMLYDGAIRFARQGIEALKTRNWEEVFSGFTRAQNIVLELLSSLNYEVDAALCGQMAGLYNFIYRHLVEAHTYRDLEKAEKALELLEYQRETWVLLLEKLRNMSAGSNLTLAPVNATSRRTAAEAPQRPASAARRPPAAGRDEQVYGTLSVQG